MLTPAVKSPVGIPVPNASRAMWRRRCCTNFRRFYTAEDQAAGEPARALAAAAKEGRFEKEGRRVRKDGTIFWANVVIDAVRTPEGVLVGFAKITRDITAQRESRIALDKARKLSFRHKKWKPSDSSPGRGTRLQQSSDGDQGQSRASSQAVSEDPRALRLLENAQQGASRGIALTQRMLAFARRQELKASAVDLALLVAACRTCFPVQSTARFIWNGTFRPSSRGAGRSQPTRTRAAQSRGECARCHARGGSIIIAAREAQMGDAPDAALSVCLSVIDTGEGMDAETLVRAPSRFSRPRGSARARGSGCPWSTGCTAVRRAARTEKRKGREPRELWLPALRLQCPRRRPRLRRQLGRASVPRGNGGGRRLVGSAQHCSHARRSRPPCISGHLGQAGLSLLAQHPEVEVLITDHAMRA